MDRSGGTQRMCMPSSSDLLKLESSYDIKHYNLVGLTSGFSPHTAPFTRGIWLITAATASVVFVKLVS